MDAGWGMKWRHDQRNANQRLDLIAMARIVFAKEMIVLRFAKIIAAHFAVVVPVKMRAAAAVATIFVQQLVMRKPLKCVCGQKAKGYAEHSYGFP